MILPFWQIQSSLNHIKAHLDQSIYVSMQEIIICTNKNAITSLMMHVHSTIFFLYLTVPSIYFLFSSLQSNNAVDISVCVCRSRFYNKILMKEILHSSQFFLQLRCTDQHWNLYAQTILSPTRIPRISITRFCVCVCVHFDAKMCMCACPCACHGGQVLGGFEVDNFNFQEESPTPKETQHRHKVEKIQDQLGVWT